MFHWLRVLVRMELIARHNLEKYFLIKKKKQTMLKLFIPTQKNRFYFICLNAEEITLHWNHNKVYSHWTD